MRPLRLQMEGLRSYRHPVDIPFDRDGLIAIIGDTGAGKSSILEAIVYALYSATSWDQRGVRALISSGAKKVSVVFDFAVGEKKWRVTRATSLTAQPVHLLECTSDADDPLARVDGEAAVNDAVKKIVGLDYDTFQSAVVLPQGRFQHLLRSSPGDRTAILKGILRLEQLEVVREMAERALSRLRPRLAAKVEERQRYRLDPVDDLMAARVRKEDAATRVSSLQGVKATLDVLRAAIAEQDERASRFNGLRQAISGAPTGMAERLGRLAELDTEIATELSTQAGLVEDAAGRERAATKLLDEANQTGVGLAQLLGASQAIPNLIEEVAALGGREQAAVNSRAGHRALLAQAEGDSIRLAELEAALLAADARKGGLAVGKDAAEERLREVSRALEAYRRKVARATEISAAVASATVALAAARSQAEAVGPEVQIARTAASTAQAELDELRRSNAAAHAAHDAQPGDACPVCSRPLPDGFAPPKIADEDVAVGVVAAARTDEVDAERKVAGFEEAARIAREDLKSSELRALEAREAVDGSVEALRAFVGAADLAADDALLLAPAGGAVNGIARELGEADGQLREAQEAVALQRGVASERAKAVTAAAEAVRGKEREIGEAGERVTRYLGAIPEGYRPPVPVTEEACRRSLDAVAARQGQLAQVDGARQAAQAERQQEEARRETLHRRRRTEVDGPVAATAAPLANLHRCIQDAAQSLDSQTPRAIANDADLITRAVWAKDLEAAASDLCERLELARTQTFDAKSAKELERTEALLGAGFESAETLFDALTGALADRLAADRDEAEAERQIPIVAALDAQIAPASALAQDLQELSAQLTDARFVRYVATRKQQALLAAASEILSSMTGDRYGFSSDFQIVDRMGDLPRDAKTLSGGETFLASLALALGLLEVAGRGGGRLDALFLDEGFASLDGGAIDEALSELERVAGRGRLVAVVSHLKAVAERIDDVLYVHRQPGDRSSVAEWIGPEERDALVMRDVELTLLA